MEKKIDAGGKSIQFVVFYKWQERDLSNNEAHFFKIFTQNESWRENLFIFLLFVPFILVPHQEMPSIAFSFSFNHK